MKILLISDTHGNIDEIPIKSILSKADICIHTGDFGFYNTKSVKALTQKEIQLQIKHSKLHDLEKEKLLTSSLAKKENAIVNNKILGNFDEYLYNNQLLNIPTYAIFGNHDDVKVVYNLKSNPIPNLHIVEENNFYKFVDFYYLNNTEYCQLSNVEALQINYNPQASTVREP